MQTFRLIACGVDIDGFDFWEYFPKWQEDLSGFTLRFFSRPFTPMLILCGFWADTYVMVIGCKMHFYCRQKTGHLAGFREVNKHFSRVYLVLTLSELVIYSCDLGKQSRRSVQCNS